MHFIISKFSCKCRCDLKCDDPFTVVALELTHCSLEKVECVVDRFYEACSNLHMQRSGMTNGGGFTFQKVTQSVDI
jgi:hypothetical protein